MSAPRGIPAGDDIVDGAKLALSESGGTAGAYGVTMSVLDDTAADKRGADPSIALTNARQILSDSAAVAVIGGLQTSESQAQATLLNAGGILQISPGAGLPALTSNTDSSNGEPGIYQPSGIHENNYIRLVPSDVVVAKGMLDAGRVRSGTKVVVESDASDEGRALQAELLRGARARGATPQTAESSADVVLYAGTDADTGEAVLEDVGRSNRRARLVGGEALAQSGVAARFPAALRDRLSVVSVAPDLSATPAGQAFAAKFKTAFGRDATGYTAIGYEAMKTVLAGIAASGVDAAVRDRLIDRVFELKRTNTLLGNLSFRADGDTTSTTTYRR